MEEKLLLLNMLEWIKELYGKEKLPPFDETILQQIKGKRVLIVDDESGPRGVAEECAAQVGCIVETAENGAEGLQRFREAQKAGKPFELVITDLRMPKMSGSEMATKIKEELKSNVPMLAISGNVDEKYDLQLFSAFIAKPFNLLNLIGCIGAILARQELLKMQLDGTKANVVARKAFRLPTEPRLRKPGRCRKAAQSSCS